MDENEIVAEDQNEVDAAVEEKEEHDDNSLIVVNDEKAPPIVGDNASSDLIKSTSIESLQLLNAEQPRGEWDRQIEFILACLGYAVGLGNVWRFPYLVYENGGGAFLIPYAIALVFTGLPSFYMELSLGQYVSLGPVDLFKRLMPALQGIGLAMVVISALVSIYYNMVVGWILFYMFSSLISLFSNKELEWSICDSNNFWNTGACFTKQQDDECKQQVNMSSVNMTSLTYFNFTCEIEDPKINYTDMRKFASQQYWSNYVLRMSAGIHEMGTTSPALIASLFVAWVICFLCMAKGIKSLGKVVYFTATFPYLILVLLCGYALSLDGAVDGIIFYLKPDFEKLLHFKIWMAAFSQIFFSLGVAFGSLITMASYNKYSNNCMRDALIVAFANCGTSFFAGFVIFSFVGFMAKSTDRPVKDVMDQGTGLAFVAYPEAFTQISRKVGKSFAAFASFIFFFMLLTLGLDSQFSMVETVTTAMLDNWTSLRKRKVLVIAGACFVMFIIGLLFTFQNGVFIFDLFNNFAASWGLLLLSIMELVLVSIFYKQDVYEWANDIRSKGFLSWFTTLGVFKFSKDIEEMLGFKQSIFWKIMWGIVSPLMLITVFLAALYEAIDKKQWKYDKEHVYPGWAVMIGWLLAIASVACIPGLCIFRVLKLVYWHRIQKITDLKKMMKKLFRTSRFWMPASHRNLYKKELKMHTATLSITEHLPTLFKDARKDPTLNLEHLKLKIQQDRNKLKNKMAPKKYRPARVSIKGATVLEKQKPQFTSATELDSLNLSDTQHDSEE